MTTHPNPFEQGGYTIINSLARITPQGVFTSFALPSSLQGDTGPSLVSGPDGNLWAVEGAVVAKISTGGTVSVVNVGISGTDFFQSPVFDSDGNLWVGSNRSTGAHIARITPDGVITRFALSSGFETAYDLVDGPDGNIWFLSNNVQTSISKITTDGIVTTFPTPANLTMSGLAASPVNNSLWFTAYAYPQTSAITNPLQIGKINTDGVITVNPEASATTADGGPIVFGPGGNLFYLEQTATYQGNSIPEAIGEADFTPLTATAYYSGGNISLAFVGPVDIATAENVDNYSLKLVFASRRGLIDLAPAAIQGVRYNAATETVSFQFSRRFAPYLQKLSAYLHYQITVNGSGTTGLATTDGQHLSGAGTGHPGTNLSALVSKMTRIHASRFRHR